MKKLLVLMTVLLVSLSSYSETIKVVLYESPPFVMEDVNGSYTGLIVDVWEKIADETGIDYEYVPYHRTINEMITDIGDGEYGLGLGSITINSKRLGIADITQPYYITDISIASNVTKSSMWSFISNIFSFDTLKYILTLMILLAFVAVIIWTVEHKHNIAFQTKLGQSLFDAYYFAAVTMVTVGYGDLAPKTNLGKVVIIIWMYVSLVITGVFIGNISSAITVDRLDTGINDITDLNKTKVGSMLNTTSATYLDSKGIKFIGYHSVEEGLHDIINGKLETFVYDTPILKYHIKKNKHKISLSDIRFDMQYYGIPMNLDDDLERTINRKLVDYIDSDLWDLTLAKYNLN